MDSLPLDVSHPAVRDYLSLVRLQVLTPLSLLINIATLLVCSVIVKPSAGSIIKSHPTSISPSPNLIAAYIVAIFLGQIGYCILLVIARKPETKTTLVKGVGLSLVFANWLMAIWAICWILEFFLLSTILLGLLTLCLLFSNIALLTYHPPTSARPLDTALIHAPLRFFLILPLSLLFPYSLFITLGLYYSPSHPEDYGRFAWPGFGVTFGANLIGLVVILMRSDIVWAVAATWICASIWSARPKPGPVYITVILFTVLHPLALFGTLLYRRITGLEGRIALPTDEEHDTGAPNGRGPREVDAEGLWGTG
ncbi:hypothetical protein DEU56DRAFT_813089 [Suillus clintonianus]|uniref:uncharacterized protein n=1 Tax=Suillus clintonianus TaxID=1904413 RepID=UPI001B86DA2C|nr:uncharacterized protein DEU56DRAFT_813089 [Suillus clintonianus]KAG2132099.1 hypothetical protein DEU56DRAFT_813089 [Suillus clintonianus]